MTVKVKLVVPAFPSFSETSLTERFGRVLQRFIALLLLRGLGAAAEKSAELLPVSVHPSPPLRTAFVVDGAGAEAVSEQLAVVP